MSRTLNVVMSVILFLTALALSACATKPKVLPVAAPAPLEVAAETPPAAEATVVTAPAPIVIAEQPPAVAEPTSQQQIIPKAKKKIVRRHLPKTKPAPLPAPAPIVKSEAPVVARPEPSPLVTMTPPTKEIEEEGFLEQYWLWLLGLGIAIAGIVVWRSKNSGVSTGAD